MCILEVIPVDIVDRIFELVDEKFKEQKDFASALGVPAPRVSEWRKRKSASYQRCLTQIADVLNTTSEWLLTGEGPREKTPALNERPFSYKRTTTVKRHRIASHAMSHPSPAPIDQVEPELREYLDQLRNRDEMRLLFSVTKGATKEQVEAIVKMIESMQGKS